MLEDKAKICENAGRLLRMTRLGFDIEHIDYLKSNGEEYALVQINRDKTTSDVYKVCITANSGAAIIKDIIRFLERQKQASTKYYMVYVEKDGSMPMVHSGIVKTREVINVLESGAVINTLKQMPEEEI